VGRKKTELIRQQSIDEPVDSGKSELEAPERAEGSGEVEDLKSAQECFESLAEELQGLTFDRTKPVKANVVHVARRAIQIKKEMVDPLAAATIDTFEEPYKSRFKRAHELISVEPMAAIFAQRMRERGGEPAPEPAKAELDLLIAEGASLDVTGKHWLDICLEFELIKADQADSIKSGTGREDLAGDLQAYGKLFGELWPDIEEIQELQKKLKKKRNEKLPEEHILTKKKIKRMAALGTKLEKAIAGISSAVAEKVDWREKVVAVYQMFERDWHIVMTSVNCHIELSRGPNATDLIPSLGQFNAEPRVETTKKNKRAKERAEKREEAKGKADTPKAGHTSEPPAPTPAEGAETKDESK
jgi:hypothetical protein